jgi:hypothetical protein
MFAALLMFQLAFFPISIFYLLVFIQPHILSSICLTTSLALPPLVNTYWSLLNTQKFYLAEHCLGLATFVKDLVQSQTQLSFDMHRLSTHQISPNLLLEKFLREHCQLLVVVCFHDRSYSKGHCKAYLSIFP